MQQPGQYSVFLHVHTHVTISLTNGANTPKKKKYALSLSLVFPPPLSKIFGWEGEEPLFLLLISIMDYAHRRVHPLDIEASMDTTPEYPPKYVMLNNNNSTNLRPPPQRRNIPRYHSNHHGSQGNSCLRCVCCCFCFWVVLIIILAGISVMLYSVLQPQIPEYNVDRFEVNAFNMEPDFSLYTEFVVTVRAYNPNERIELIYGKGSSVVVLYSDSTLCSGKLPAYHQPYKNTTMISIVLKGKSEFGSGLQEALMDNRDTGKIPLLVMVKAPIAVVLQNFPLREVVVYVNCSLVVDNLSPNKKAQILSSKYDYSVGLWIQYVIHKFCSALLLSSFCREGKGET